MNDAITKGYKMIDLNEINSDVLTANVDNTVLNLANSEVAYTKSDSYLDEMIDFQIENRVFDENYGF